MPERGGNEGSHRTDTRTNDHPRNLSLQYPLSIRDEVRSDLDYAYETGRREEREAITRFVNDYAWGPYLRKCIERGEHLEQPDA